MTDDEQLLDRLRAIVAQMDPPPGFTTEAARAALATRRIDSALAQLILDSATDTPALARGEEAVRLLSFETATVSIELQVQETAGTVSLRGLVSGATGDVVVETGADRFTTPISAEGWFVVTALRPGPLRLRLRAEDGTDVTTSWVFL